MSSLATKKPVTVQNDVLERLKTFWAGRTPKQRVYLGVALSGTLAVAALLGQMIANPDYKPLMTGLDPADVQTISSELAQKKIPFRVSADGGSITVPADQVDAARMEVASHDAPHSGRIGFEIFDKVSWGQTEFDEKVDYQRALEGELERTIETMSHVKSARVHLVMATDSVFLDRERGAKASVALQLHGGALTREQVTAIARLVAGAVDELKPADVNIIDADSNRPLTTVDGEAEDSDGQLQQQLTKRLMETLAPVVGADHLHATVNVEYDRSTSEEDDEKYDPAVSVPLNMQTSEESTTGASTVGGVPGTSSNVPGAKVPALTTSAAPGQTSKSQTASYGVNRVTRHIVEPAGRIRRITAAVVVDDAVDRKQVKGKWVETQHARSPEELKLIADLSQAAIGYDSSRGDVVSVENLAFEHDGSQDLTPPTWIDKTHRAVDDNASVLRYGMLALLFGLVYLLMFRPIQKRALEVTAAPMELAGGMERMPMEELPAGDALAQRALLLKKQLSDSVRMNPEGSMSTIRSWLQEDKV